MAFGRKSVRWVGAARSIKNLTDHRRRKRAAGLREVWLPDTRSPDFADICRRQAKAVGASDPAGDEIMEFIAAVSDWSEE